MSKSDYLEAKILDHVTGKTTYTKPTAYVALFTAAPSDAGGGTEVSGGSYARVATAGADWNAAATVSGTTTTSNANAITFPTASGSWGTCTHWGIFDASTAGNLLRWAALTTSKSPASGDTPSFAAGTLVLGED